eukprot:1188226-Prorocentrum_minimum.AAC.5
MGGVIKTGTRPVPAQVRRLPCFTCPTLCTVFVCEHDSAKTLLTRDSTSHSCLECFLQLQFDGELPPTGNGRPANMNVATPGAGGTAVARPWMEEVNNGWQ